MTREKAIEIVKEFISGTCLHLVDQEALETLIPELKESEDENLKNKSGYYKAGKFWKASTLWNATKNKIPQRVFNRYILQECTWNIGTLQQFANEVKNVQEVSLDHPIILDMNGNILDGAHRVVKAYLEGKDIDIVYLGDDEWPEPDYDEEKAVKESEDEKIRNELLEYLTVTCQQDFVARPERQRWLAYLERQKEPKPAWSEDDEKMLNELITIVDGGKVTSGTYLSEYVAWLKSLRPQPKQKRYLSMKDQWCCNAASAAVRDSDAHNGEEKQFILDFLQRCEPQHYRKPSEEQATEVDLGKEIELVKGGYERVGVDWNNYYELIARRFFELGRKAKEESK